ncbi:MAG: serine protease [Pseudomonadota bacterium]
MPAIYFLLLLLLPLYCPAEIKNNSIAVKRIVGGQQIVDNRTPGTSESIETIEQWPWVVALTDGYRQFCGASLINHSWLLTAAHCVINSPAEIQAIFLSSSISAQTIQSFTRNISEIIIHPDYDTSLDSNDIALLRLELPVNNISPVLLPGSSYDEFTISAGTMSTVLGWGVTPDKSDNEVVLRKVEVPITEQSTCLESLAKYAITLEDSMVCAGYPEGGKDACSGDSGSPLVSFSSTLKNWVQVGIVSFGIGCALPDEYGVYTRVSKYTQAEGFINKTICESFPTSPDMQVTQQKGLIEINFSTPEQNKKFRLYYAPYPEMTPIHYLDILGTKFSINLAENETYYTASQTQKMNCLSPFNDIKIVNQ